MDTKKKTTTAIVGPSGGGKTTLTSLIARFWDVDEGKVTLGGRNVKDYSFVFQRVYLFEDTIANNIRFGRPEASMEEVTEAVDNLTREKTITMIAHRLKTVRNADQIVVVDKGRIVQKGTHDELIADQGIYRDFVTGRKNAVSWKI